MSKYRLQDPRPTRSVRRDPFPQIRFEEQGEVTGVLSIYEILTYCLGVALLTVILCGVFS